MRSLWQVDYMTRQANISMKYLHSGRKCISWPLFISSISIFIYLYLDNGLTSLLLMQSGFSFNHRIRSYKKVRSVRTELFWKSTGHVWWSMRVRRERSMASSDTTISRMMARPLSGSRSNSTGLLYANVQHHSLLLLVIYQQNDTWRF